jgi:outer membrane receptor for ferrienterochelin and colicin
VLVQNSQRTSIFRNVDRARTVGCEIAAGADLFEHVRLALNYTYQDARDESGIPARDGNQLPGGRATTSTTAPSTAATRAGSSTS